MILWRAALRRALTPLYRALALVAAARVVVAGWSMYPVLAPGEYVLFDRLAYLWRRPARGDIVLARVPQVGNSAMIKRVVGIPGDTLEYSMGRLLVNGTPLGQSGTTSGTGFDARPAAERRWVLDKDEYFLLGDAWDLSTDSRSFGTVLGEAIRAKAWLVYWPASHWRRVETP